MSTMLEVAGLVCLVGAGFLVAVPVGVAAGGVACLVVAWRQTR